MTGGSLFYPLCFLRQKTYINTFLAYNFLLNFMLKIAFKIINTAGSVL